MSSLIATSSQLISPFGYHCWGQYVFRWRPGSPSPQMTATASGRSLLRPACGVSAPPGELPPCHQLWATASGRLLLRPACGVSAPPGELPACHWYRRRLFLYSRVGPCYGGFLAGSWHGWHHLFTLEPSAALFKRFKDSLGTRLATSLLIVVTTSRVANFRHILACKVFVGLTVLTDHSNRARGECPLNTYLVATGVEKCF